MIVDVFGVKVDSSSLEEVLRKLDSVLAKKTMNRPFFVVTVNPEFVVVAQSDLGFKRILNQADLATADGVGLRLAGVNRRATGREIVEKLVTKPGIRVFYLGGRNGVAQKMAQKYGGEWDGGEVDIKTQELKNTNKVRASRAKNQNNLRIVSKINKYKPDVLLVAYGAPWQEKWLYGHLKTLKCKVAMGVGGSFDVLSGRVPRPPDWVSRLGCEWLWRLTSEPWRWRRQLRLLKFLKLWLFS